MGGDSKNKKGHHSGGGGGGSGGGNGFKALGLSEPVYSGIVRMGFRVRAIILINLICFNVVVQA